jgi:hypothetical protein
MATKLGTPSISDPRANDLRAFQTAVSNIRQRIEAIETQAAQNTGAATSSTNISSLVLNTLRAQLAALQANLSALEQGLTTPGMVTWDGTTLNTRILQGAGGIVITNPDGLSGDPVITGGGGSADSVLYDNEGRAGLDTAGGAIYMSTGA